MPSYEIFMEQDEAYRNSVIPKDIKKRFAIEAAETHFFKELVGDEGFVIGINKFGASAPGEIVMKEYGFSDDLDLPA